MSDLGMKFNIMRSANRQGRLATLTASVQMDFDNDLDVDSRLRQLFISRCEERGVAPIGRVLVECQPNLAFQRVDITVSAIVSGPLKKIGRITQEGSRRRPVAAWGRRRAL